MGVETDIAVIKTNVAYIKESIEDIKQGLRKNDERVDHLEEDVVRIKEQNGLMGKLVNYFVPFITGITGVLAGHYWK